MSQWFIRSQINVLLVAKRFSSYTTQKRRTTNSDLRTVSYLGAKLWNDNLALLVDTTDGDFCTFKSSLKNIDDMTTNAIDFPYV